MLRTNVWSQNIWSQTVSGIGHGSEMAHCVRVEGDMLKGVHRMSLAMHQYEAIEVAFDALEETFGWEIPVKSLWAVCLTPFVLGIIAAKTGFDRADATDDKTNATADKGSTKRLPYVKKAVLLLQSQIGNLCQVAMLVSATVNIINGQVLKGALTISCLALGLFSRLEYLPQSVADKFDYAFSIIGLTNSVFTGSWVISTVSAFNLADMVLEIAVRLKGTKAPPIPTVNVTLAEFKGKTIKEFEINPVHLSIPLTSLPDAPQGIDIEILNRWFKEISWNSVLWEEKRKIIDENTGEPKIDENTLEPMTYKLEISAKSRLYTLVTEDVQWKEDPLRKQDIDALKSYVEEGMRKFIEILSRRENDDSAKIKAMLCIQKMEKMTSEERFDSVINFGLAGNYCPRGFGNEINLVYAALFGDQNDNSIPGRIHQALHSEREYEFKSFINRAYNYDIRGWKITNLLLQLFIGDQQDPHSDDVFQANFGHEYNLLTVEEAEANLPVEHRSGPLSNMTLDLPWRLLARRDFKMSYTTEVIIKTVSDALLKFQKDEARELVNWFENNFPDEWKDIQESFPANGEGGHHFIQIICDEVGDEVGDEGGDSQYIIKEEWVLPMLVKMNVLRAKAIV